MEDPIISIEAYCQAIGISPPRYTDFDIRRFEDNMPTIRQRVSPFKHELFAIALKLEGTGSIRTGLDEYLLDDAQFVFFNSPYQLLGWDIVPDWKGYYVMFTRSFASVYLRIPDLTVEFPFLRLDRAVPFQVSANDVRPVNMIFEKVHAEYYGEAEDKFGFIAAYTNLLLRYVKRIFITAPPESSDLDLDNVATEYRLVSRFQVLLEEAFYPDSTPRKHPLSVTEIAERLFVHPNYLGSIIKRVTGQTAKNLVDQQALAVAKRLLAQPDQAVKEVAWVLGFADQTHFTRFFRRLTGESPTEWREQST